MAHKEKTYQEFESDVQHVSNRTDYKQNKELLKNIPIRSYDTFIKMLKHGGEIEKSIKASEIIFDMSKNTPLLESEIVEMLGKFRWINSLIDSSSY